MRQLPYTYIRHANQEKDRASSIDGSVYAIRAIFFASLLVVVYHTKKQKKYSSNQGTPPRRHTYDTVCLVSRRHTNPRTHTPTHTHTEGCDRKTDAAYIESIVTHIMKWLDLRSEFLQRPRCHRHQVAKCAYTRA